MRTIAITIDEATLKAVDDVTRSAATSRSAIIREALAEFLARRTARERDEADRHAYATHRDLVSRQAAALVADQAEP